MFGQTCREGQLRFQRVWFQWFWATKCLQSYDWWYSLEDGIALIPTGILSKAGIGVVIICPGVTCGPLRRLQAVLPQPPPPVVRLLPPQPVLQFLVFSIVFGWALVFNMQKIGPAQPEKGGTGMYIFEKSATLPEVSKVSMALVIQRKQSGQWINQKKLWDIVAMGRNWVQYPGYPQDKAASSDQKSATGGFLGNCLRLPQAPWASQAVPQRAAQQRLIHGICRRLLCLPVAVWSACAVAFLRMREFNILSCWLMFCWSNI